MKTILLNGPPGSGKDFAAKTLAIHFLPTMSVRIERFSMPNKRAFAGTVNALCGPSGLVTPYENDKESLIPWLGVSYRQWQIDYSEKFMKPLYGEDIFARLLLRRIDLRKDDNWLCIVPDCGFQIEASTVVEALGPDNVLLVGLYREGHDFSRDSREYVASKKGWQFADVDNAGDERFAFLMIDLVTKFLQGAKS